MSTQGSPGAAPGSLKARLVATWRRLRGGTLSPGRAAVSVGVGLFIGCLPVYGVQLFVVLAVCIPLKLDAPVAYLATHLANPLSLPFLLALEFEIGSLVLTGKHAELDLDAMSELGVRAVGAQLALGAAILGPLTGLLGGAATWLLMHRLHDARERARAAARRRTLERYAGATRAVRGYVTGKLFTDPVLASLLRLEGSFGRVVDAGAGYGQLGLALLDLGRAESLLGFDADDERVAVAREAGRGDARFEEADLEHADFTPADTILFIDSLRYLPVEGQDLALDRAVAALAPGGRLVIREVDAGRSWRSSVSEGLARRSARRSGKPVSFGFRSADSLARALEARGLACAARPHEAWSLLETGLLVATKPLVCATDLRNPP